MPCPVWLSATNPLPPRRRRPARHNSPVANLFCGPARTDIRGVAAHPWYRLHVPPETSGLVILDFKIRRWTRSSEVRRIILFGRSARSQEYPPVTRLCTMDQFLISIIVVTVVTYHGLLFTSIFLSKTIEVQQVVANSPGGIGARSVICFWTARMGLESTSVTGLVITMWTFYSKEKPDAASNAGCWALLSGMCCIMLDEVCSPYSLEYSSLTGF